ncbi:hypothetical protein [Streptomyces sp. NPDC095613]|uniref:hypothetical protein n=1 Tax=Streptomyces sp. NPDC095613 TaxID=3155540 RepID=UPI00332D104A
MPRKWMFTATAAENSGQDRVLISGTINGRDITADQAKTTVRRSLAKDDGLHAENIEVISE